jgi:hypothetical protein
MEENPESIQVVPIPCCTKDLPARFVFKRIYQEEENLTRIGGSELGRSEWRIAGSAKQTTDASDRLTIGRA